MLPGSRKRKAEDSKLDSDSEEQSAKCLKVESSRPDAACSSSSSSQDFGESELENALDLCRQGRVAEGFVALQQLADTGSVEAHYRLGCMTMGGYGVPVQSKALARPHLAFAAARGHRKAAVLLAYADDNWDEAFEPLGALAEEGDPDAQNFFGFLHAFGTDTVPCDPVKAFTLYMRAAQQGHATALTNVGYCFFSGQGVSRNLDSAVEWYLLAAKQGHAGAMNNLGSLYCEKKEFQNALAWFLRGSEQGHAASQIGLAIMFVNGMGVPIDFQQGFKLLSSAASKQHPTAQYFLAQMYEQGIGVPASPSVALELYRRAAHDDHMQSRDAVHRLMRSLFHS